MNLEQIVARATARLAVSGVDGWGLAAPDEEFDMVIVSGSDGCDSDTCNHRSHDSAAPIIRLIPVAGTLVALEDGYYVLRLPEGDRYYHLETPRAFHASLARIEAGHVPEYVLAPLAVAV